DLDELLTSGVLRRAAGHLVERTAEPLSDLPADDEDFARLMAGLVELAGRIPDPSPDRLEHARLVLERDRLDRAIIRVRGPGAGTGELAQEREGVPGGVRPGGVARGRGVVREAIRAGGAKLEPID